MVQNLALLGEDPWERSVMLFVRGPGYDFDEVSVEEHIESWKELRWVVDKCGNRCVWTVSIRRIG